MKNQVDQQSVKDAKEAEKARKDFLAAYENLCKIHGLQLVARGQLQPVEGSIYRVTVIFEIAPMPKEQVTK